MIITFENQICDNRKRYFYVQEVLKSGIGFYLLDECHHHCRFLGCGLCFFLCVSALLPLCIGYCLCISDCARASVSVFTWMCIFILGMHWVYFCVPVFIYVSLSTSLAYKLRSFSHVGWLKFRYAFKLSQIQLLKKTLVWTPKFQIQFKSKYNICAHLKARLREFHETVDVKEKDDYALWLSGYDHAQNIWLLALRKNLINMKVTLLK